METVLECLTVSAELIQRLRIRRDVLTDTLQSGFVLATELADYLVKKGVPFRDAHRVVGQLVRHCTEHKVTLHDLSFADLKTVSPHFSQDAMACLTLEGAIDRKTQIGGTSRKQVVRQMHAWESRLAKRSKG